MLQYMFFGEFSQKMTLFFITPRNFFCKYSTNSVVWMCLLNAMLFSSAVFEPLGIYLFFPLYVPNKTFLISHLLIALSVLIDELLFILLIVY